MKRLLFLLLASFPVVSFATLGQDSASIEEDNRALASMASKVFITESMSQNTTTQKSLQYQIYTIQAIGGITVKEFFANGRVFAISWHGMRNPDLQQLLGKYFPDFKKVKSSNYGLRESRVSSGNLVVNIHGVIGDFQGVAYDLSLLPEGFNLLDLYK